MIYDVVIEAPAKDEIERAYLWLAAKSPRAAWRWQEGLELAIASLARFPERCSIAPEYEALGLHVRQLLYGKRRGVYRILFTIKEHSVHILHVRHAARDNLL
jgi:plasmid stabilization system protein ParE